MDDLKKVDKMNKTLFGMQKTFGEYAVIFGQKTEIKLAIYGVVIVLYYYECARAKAQKTRKG